MEHLQQKSLSYPELASFCGEMGMILRSGISALEGLELPMEDTQNDAEKTLLDTMYQSHAIRRHLRRCAEPDRGISLLSDSYDCHWRRNRAA